MRNLSRILLALTCGLLLCRFPVRAGDVSDLVDKNVIEYGRKSGAKNALAEIEEEHRLSLEYQTPHTAWAKPYAGGTLRVLAICDASRGDTLTREIEELMERADVTVAAAYGAFTDQDPTGLWVGGKAGEARLLRLLEQPYDVFLFLHLSPQYLSPASREKFEAAVNHGAGVVMVGMDDRALSSAQLPAPTDPEVPEAERKFPSLQQAKYRLREKPDYLNGLPPYALYQVEDGRVISLPPRPDIPYRVGWQVGHEYWQEQLIRALLWTAKREPKAAVRLTLDPPAPAWGVPANVAVAWENAPLDGATLEVRARLEDGRMMPLGTKPVAGAAGKATFALPRLPAGAHHLEALLRGPQGSECWAVLPCPIASPRTVTLSLAKDWGEIGETIAGHVASAGEAPAKESMVVQLIDRFDRVLAQTDLPPGGGDFTFPLPAWMPMLLQVKAVLRSDGQEVTSAYQYFNVTHRSQDRFNFVMWGSHAGTMNAYAVDSMAHLGVSVILGRNSREEAAYGIPSIPYTTRILNLLTKSQQITEGGCWNDLPVIQPKIDKIAQEALSARKAGVFVYSLGDEGVVEGSCLHQACLAAYQHYLQGSYGTIAALNAAWGTAYKSFDEVALSLPKSAAPPEETAPEGPDDPDASPGTLAPPPPLADNDEKLALLAKNYPRWYDRQAFKAYNFVQYCQRFADAFRRIDPLARTGFEGAGQPVLGLGTDAEAIVNTLGFWGPYGADTDELIRSIAPRSLVRSNWIGYPKDANGLLASYWRTFTRGEDVFWWSASDVGSYHGFLAPDLAPFAATKEMLKDTQVVRDGLGDLLYHGTRLDDGIALLYSHPSGYAATVQSGPSFSLSAGLNIYAGEHDCWHRAIRALGLQFSYVTDRMLSKAPLDVQRFKVLILPRDEALSDAAAQAIRDYVAAGGTVIADVRPGICTEHCRPRPTGCLDDLFGIKRGEEQVGRADALTMNGTIDGHQLTLAWSLEDAGAGGKAKYGARVDPAVALAGGEALGSANETPIGIVRNTGAGRAVLLNFPLSTLAATTPEPALRFLESLLATAGVSPAIRLQDAQGKPLRDVEIIRWQNGGETVITLFRSGGDAEPAQMTLSHPATLYDLRTGAALGNTTNLPVQVTPYRPTWLAALPAPAPPITLTLDHPLATPGQVLHAAVSLPAATGQHAVRLRLTAPNGPHAEWADRIVLAGGQPVDIDLPIAFNDPTGEWTLTATDLLGGSATVTFQF